MTASQKNRVAQLRRQGLSTAAAVRQMNREQVAEADRNWREQGYAEQGGARSGWGF